MDLTRTATCAHCGTLLSMLDLNQAQALVAQLQRADRANQEGDPTLPLQLERARRDVDAAFAGLPRSFSFDDVAASGLVAAGLSALAGWLRER